MELSLWLSFEKSYLKDFDLFSPVESYPRLKVKEKKDEIVKMYNIELIFSRFMSLLAANLIDLEDVFSYKLSNFYFWRQWGAQVHKIDISVKIKLKIEISLGNIKPDVAVVWCFTLLSTGPKKDWSVNL